MDRASFIKKSLTGVAAATVASSTLALNSCGPDNTEVKFPKEKPDWENWSRLQYCNPSKIATPAGIDELTAIMKKAKNVRLVGSGHSFMPLVPTENTLLSLDAFSGVSEINMTDMTAKIQAGSKLSYISKKLHKKGQALNVLPDIYYQSLAGAMATATHGTGRDKMAMHAYVKSLTLVTPEGEVLECSETKNKDIFKAANVSIGMLGAVTEYTMQNVAQYKLQRKMHIRTLEYFLENGEKLFKETEDLEYYYIPHSNLCAEITHESYEGEIRPREKTNDESDLQDLKSIRNFLSWSPKLRSLAIGSMVTDGELIEESQNFSHVLLSQPRLAKFNESEYHLPLDQAFDCIKKVIDKINSRSETYFPMEFRHIKGDDNWLSPFYKKDCISIAIHADNEENYLYLLDEIGPIFKAHNGRPHWGKLNNMTRDEFANAYPKWDDFLEIRAKLDPKGKMLNEYTRKIFG